MDKKQYYLSRSSFILQKIYFLISGPCHRSHLSDRTLDPDHYMMFSSRQKWRKIGYTFDVDVPKHDSEMHGPRWLRFLGKLPDNQIEDRSCGVEFPAWIQVGGHPKPEDGIVDRTICFGKNCANPTKIQVAACTVNDESYFVYKLERTIDSDSGYCYMP